MRKIHLTSVFIMFVGSISAMENPVSGVANQPEVVPTVKAQQYSLGKQSNNITMGPELSDESLASKLPKVREAIEKARQEQAEKQQAAEVRAHSSDSRQGQPGCCGVAKRYK